jgi:non-specific serine/threonine protein kinase
VRNEDTWYRAIALNVLGTMHRYRGAHDDARRLYGEALTESRRGDLWWPAALAYTNLGVLADLERDHAEAAEMLEQCVAIAREGGDEWMEAAGLTNLGRATRHAGDLDRACACQAEALAIYARLRNSWGIAVCLDAFAALAATEGRYARAARLFGAEEALRVRGGIALWQAIRADHDAAVEATASALGEREWARAWSAGQALTQDEAIAEALAYAA